MMFESNAIYLQMGYSISDFLLDSIMLFRVSA